MPGTPIPTGYRLEIYFTPTGRRGTRLRQISEVDWEEVIDLAMGRRSANPITRPLAEGVLRFVVQTAGAGKTRWPVRSGRSRSGFYVARSQRFSSAKPRYNSRSRDSDAAYVVANRADYAKAIERGSYDSRTGYRRSPRRALLRAERTIRSLVLRGRDVNDTIARTVTTIWRRQARESRRRVLR